MAFINQWPTFVSGFDQSVVFIIQRLSSLYGVHLIQWFSWNIRPSLYVSQMALKFSSVNGLHWMAGLLGY